MSAAYRVRSGPFDVADKTWWRYGSVDTPTDKLGILGIDASKAPGTRRVRGRFA